MTIAISYPGVYAQVISAPNPPTGGIATSTTVFVGRSVMGPVDTPITVFNYQQFSRVFGGLDENYPLSYAVRQFFANAGAQAIIVRAFTAPTIDPKTKKPIDDGRLAVISLPSASSTSDTGADTHLTVDPQAAPTPPSPFLVAISPGTWGAGLTVIIDQRGIPVAPPPPKDKVAETSSTGQTPLVLDTSMLFNLTVIYTPTKGSPIVETFQGVSVADNAGARRLDRVLTAGSTLVRVPLNDDQTPCLPKTMPPNTTPKFPLQATLGKDSPPLKSLEYLTALGLSDGSGAPPPPWPDDMLFNILVLPPDSDDFWSYASDLYMEAAEFCNQQSAFLIMDPPPIWETYAKNSDFDKINLNDLGGLGIDQSQSAAVFFPSILAVDPLSSISEVKAYPPSGFMAGLFAQKDSDVGVWAAAAGLDSPVSGCVGLNMTLNNGTNGELYQKGINCLRTFPVGGTVPWGARTLRGAPPLADEYNVIPVRRMALYIQQWVLLNTRWAVFKPNTQSLWSQLRLQLNTFLSNLWRQDALFGTTQDDAFFVICDATNNPVDQIKQGVVNIQIGFAPVRPAEFVVVTIQQSYKTT
jgi:uncharacterized protein